MEHLEVDKCYIKEIDVKEACEFCDSNHLLDYIESDIHLGLYIQNELIQVMTFKNIDDNFELTRMCTKLNMYIDSSKLLKYFEVNYKPKGIVVHVNRRYSDGVEYEKLGFKFKYNTEPNYFYIKGFDYDKNIPESSNILSVFDENMYANNYRKIYDCGDKVYSKKIIQI